MRAFAHHPKVDLILTAKCVVVVGVLVMLERNAVPVWVSSEEECQENGRQLVCSPAPRRPQYVRQGLVDFPDGFQRVESEHFQHHVVPVHNVPSGEPRVNEPIDEAERVEPLQSILLSDANVEVISLRPRGVYHRTQHRQGRLCQHQIGVRLFAHLLMVLFVRFTVAIVKKNQGSRQTEHRIFERGVVTIMSGNTLVCAVVDDRESMDPKASVDVRRCA
jgi:hypothetical protein